MPGKSPSEAELRIWIAADAREVWRSWVDAGLLSKWFQHSARHFSPDTPPVVRAEAATGDRYDWSLAHGHRSLGRFLEVDRERCVVHFSFEGKGGMSTRVEIDRAGGGALVRLKHSGIPAGDFECYADVKCGWTFYLANLKSYHEGGVDLREHLPERIRAGVVNI